MVRKTKTTRVPQALESKKRQFEPGMTVELSGIYEAMHGTHRVTHEVTLLEGEHFPPCARCRDRVRFRLLKAVKRLNSQNAPIVHMVGVFLPEKAA